MTAFDWNDVRFALAAARDGSALTAARALKVSHPTVGRRIAALEAALGLPLFERSQTGLRLTDQARALLPQLEALEEAARNVEAAAQATARQVSGVLRVTTNEIIANYALPPALRRFRAQFPKVHVELIVTDDFVDLSTGEADIAIRAGGQPSRPGLVARRLATATGAVFGSPDYFAQHGRPASIDDLNDHLFVGGEGPYVVVEQVLRQLAPRVRVGYRSSSSLNMISHARHGLGLVVLPQEFVPADLGLVACLALPELQLGVWLITHERLRHAPHARAFLDFVAANLLGRSRA